MHRVTVSRRHLVIYLCDWCFTPYSRMFHLYDGNKHYGERKPGTAPGNSTTIYRLLEDFPISYGRGESWHELVLNWTTALVETPGLLRWGRVAHIDRLNVWIQKYVVWKVKNSASRNYPTLNLFVMYYLFTQKCVNLYIDSMLDLWASILSRK